MNKIVEPSLPASPAASPFVPTLLKQNQAMDVQEKHKDQLQPQPSTTNLKQTENQNPILPRNGPTNKFQPVPKSGNRASRAVFGSGITESILSKAKERKKLLSIGLDEVTPISL